MVVMDQKPMFFGIIDVARFCTELERKKVSTTKRRHFSQKGGEGVPEGHEEEQHGECHVDMVEQVLPRRVVVGAMDKGHRLVHILQAKHKERKHLEQMLRAGVMPLSEGG